MHKDTLHLRWRGQQVKPHPHDEGKRKGTAGARVVSVPEPSPPKEKGADGARVVLAPSLPHPSSNLKRKQNPKQLEEDLRRKQNPQKLRQKRPQRKTRRNRRKSNTRRRSSSEPSGSPLAAALLTPRPSPVTPAPLSNPPCTRNVVGANVNPPCTKDVVGAVENPPCMRTSTQPLLFSPPPLPLLFNSYKAGVGRQSLLFNSCTMASDAPQTTTTTPPTDDTDATINVNNNSNNKGGVSGYAALSPSINQHKHEQQHKQQQNQQQQLAGSSKNQ